MTKDLEVEDQISDHEKWHRRLRAAGVYEREQERQSFLYALCISLGTNSDKVDESFTFDEWLRETVYFKHHNGCSLPLVQLRQLDRWLWEYEPIPFSLDSVTSYLFNWNDVVHARTVGKVATQQQWEQLVDERYYACWLQVQHRLSAEDTRPLHGVLQKAQSAARNQLGN